MTTISSHALSKSGPKLHKTVFVECMRYVRGDNGRLQCHNNLIMDRYNDMFSVEVVEKRYVKMLSLQMEQQ